MLALYLCLNYAVYRLVLFPSYFSLERKGAQKDVSRCEGALQREIEHLNLLTNDWAAWDDTYRFIQDRNEDYIESNLVIETFSDNRLDLIYFLNSRRETVWGEVRDPVTHDIMDLNALSEERITKVQILFQPKDSMDSVSGIWTASGIPMLISSRPILKSDNEGPLAGHLIMGRILTRNVVNDLSEQTRVPHRYDLIRNGRPAAFPEDVFNRITTADPIACIPAGDAMLHAYAVVSDISGQPALMLQADIDRSILARGRSALWLAMISAGGVGILLLGGTLILLNSIVVKPLSKLTRQVVSYSNHPNNPIEALSRRSDEIGLLGKEFERMTMQLKGVHDGLKASNLQLAHEARERALIETKLRALSSEMVKTEERERRRIAIELHDRIGQALAVLQMQLELLFQQNAVTSGVEPGKAAKIRSSIESIIQDSRSLTFEISPPVLYELGLGPAIEWLAEEISQRYDLKVEVRDRLSVTLDDSMRVLVFRSIRELLYNVAKHARAESVWIHLEQTPLDLKCIVKDDGIGFRLEANALSESDSAGFGLFSIRERFFQFGGKMDIESPRAGGTVVTLSLPLASVIGREAETP